MRGLKLALGWKWNVGESVASFTDAWIETHESMSMYERRKVASFTDAWIETTESHLESL